ncbi:MAG: helix-turn-helix transcriptional regulator [Ruminococcaceae bacterium]|nr:helix-turn-helix transcriptional regulator [Oscillospiraceae bacterium]
MSLASQLRLLRKERNVTQKELSRETGIPLQSIINYENDRREPNSKAMAALERFFGVSGEYLRGEVNRDDFLRKSELVDGSLDDLVDRFVAFQGEFRIANQDKQLDGTAALEAALEYVTAQLALGSAADTSLQSFSTFMQTFAGLAPAQAAAVVRTVQAVLAQGDKPTEDELIQKYRQLDQRGRVAVMDNLRREYDYLYKPVEVPYVAFGGGKQTMVTTQAEEDEMEQRLKDTAPPTDL